MSFFEPKVNQNPNFKNYDTKPKLVDNKIFKKIKMKKLEIQKNKFSSKFAKLCSNFFKDNIGILTIFICLFLLLSYRYNDVKKRRSNIR